MQSRTTEASPETSVPSGSASPTSNTQHGLHDRHHGAADPPLGRAHRPSSGSPSTTASADGSSPNPGGTSTRSRGTSSNAPRAARLNSDSAPGTRSPVDRIDLHENASKASRSAKRASPGFQIVKKPMSLKQGSITIDEFPNEVLTHIFSHLPPAGLTAISLVSQRFHTLVTTPHAWRAAFSRFFPGASLAEAKEARLEVLEAERTRSDKRSFTRLTALASWRSEYILRTKLLRAVERGKPAAPSDGEKPGRAASGAAHVTYNTNLLSTINHIDANWDTGPVGKRSPRFIHGADDEGSASVSDPTKAAPGTWGFADWRIYRCFAEEYPGVREYGLGSGEIVGVPNPMDVSQKHGVVYAEGLPGGNIFYRSADEKRGRYLLQPQVHSSPEHGVPNLDAARETPCCVWIAKSLNVPTISNGLVGLMSGSSYGIVTTYSLGTTGLRERRLERGEVTARWTLSPGIPIIALAIDEEFSPRRAQAQRIWAVALNALGEIFVLKSLPVRTEIPPMTKLSDARIDELAWETGRTVAWSLVEPTMRMAKPDPHQLSGTDGAYTPRGSWNGSGLSAEQVAEEVREIQTFVTTPPKHFQEACVGWDMQRRLEVDFAGDDENGAGEAVLVLDCGVEDGVVPAVKRFTRIKSGFEAEPSMGAAPRSPVSEVLEPGIAESAGDAEDVWCTSTFGTTDMKLAFFTTSALDKSRYAVLTAGEDPLLSMSASANSSPLSTPSGDLPPLSSRTDIPGQRARLLAAGTSLGAILLWDARATTAPRPGLTNTVAPVAVIFTDSPQISSLALTGLYLVHGGNDGLVQAWDPLRSTARPLRTLNSRFSSRARRRLAQAAGPPAAPGANLFAAGAVCLDPDPTALRGVVGLGAHLRYWSFGGHGADAYGGRRRRAARRGARGSNAGAGAERYSATGRGALLDQIADEAREFRRDEKERRRERARLQARFGVGLLGQNATDAEVLAYATMLSEEAARGDASRRQSAATAGSTPTEATSSPSLARARGHTGDFDAEMAEAIRLSLEASSGPDASSPSAGPSAAYGSRSEASSSPRDERLRTWDEDEDLELATRLSLAEEASRQQADAASSPRSA